MEPFEQILIKHNCARRAHPSEIKIEEIEEVAGFGLPDEYKIYLHNYQSFDDFIGQEFLRLFGIDELVEMNRVYLIFENLPNTLGIGGNGSSELIALEKLDSDHFRVVLTPLIDLDRKYHVEIGNSFSDFLIRLDNGRNWFDK